MTWQKTYRAAKDKTLDSPQQGRARNEQRAQTIQQGDEQAEVEVEGKMRAKEGREEDKGREGMRSRDRNEGTIIP